jgi:hypothetical protein
MMLGARERIVIRRRSWREKATSWPDSGFLIVRSIKGITGSAGGAGIAMVPGTDISGKGRVWALRKNPGMKKRKEKKTALQGPAGFMD